MKTSRLSGSQIIAVLKQAEGDSPIRELELNLRIKPRKRIVREKPIKKLPDGSFFWGGATEEGGRSERFDCSG
jgi:hypothetical protein